MLKQAFALSSTPSGSVYTTLLFNVVPRTVILPVFSALHFFLHTPAQPKSYTVMSRTVCAPTPTSNMPVLVHNFNTAVYGIVACLVFVIAGSTLVFNGKGQPPSPPPPPPPSSPPPPPPSSNGTNSTSIPIEDDTKRPDGTPPPPPPPPTPSTPAVDPKDTRNNGIARWMILLLVVAYALALCTICPDWLTALCDDLQRFVQSRERRASPVLVHLDVVNDVRLPPPAQSPSPSPLAGLLTAAIPPRPPLAQQFAYLCLSEPVPPQVLYVPTYLQVQGMLIFTAVLIFYPLALAGKPWMEAKLAGWNRMHDSEIHSINLRGDDDVDGNDREQELDVVTAPETSSLDPSIAPLVPITVKSARGINPAAVAFIPKAKPKPTLNTVIPPFVPTPIESTRGNPNAVTFTPSPQAPHRPRGRRVRSRRQPKVIAYYTAGYQPPASNPTMQAFVPTAATSSHGINHTAVAFTPTPKPLASTWDPVVASFIPSTVQSARGIDPSAVLFTPGSRQ